MACLIVSGTALILGTTGTSSGGSSTTSTRPKQTHLLNDGGPINISYMNYDWTGL
jgi:hypothetical protein